MFIPYVINKVNETEQMTVYLGGVPTEFDSSHPKYHEIKNNISTLTEKEVRDLIDSAKQLRKAVSRFGNVKVEDGQVTYKGEEVHGFLADRMVQMLKDGMDIKPWALFLENLKKNPAKHAVDELYGWLEHANMPITDRGRFLAYKKVKDDYTSYRNNPDGTSFHNDIGTFVSMDRNKVDDDRTRTCSSGLHFCSWDYLPSYMGNRGKVVILEINPEHVVSIPTDYNNAKGRAAGYMIIGEIPEDKCEHAFENTPYVSVNDIEWSDIEIDEDIDYSEIEDGWYDDIGDDYDEELDYESGYVEGLYAGKNGYSDVDMDLSEDCFHTHFSYQQYLNGFKDGWYNGNKYEAVKEPTLPLSYNDFDNYENYKNSNSLISRIIREMNLSQYELELLTKIWVSTDNV